MQKNDMSKMTKSTLPQRKRDEDTVMELRNGLRNTRGGEGGRRPSVIENSNS
jgi:hypothetical protein